MNFQLTHPLPERCMVAVSGGVDSMSVLHFLSQIEGRVDSVVHVNHSSGDFAERAEKLVRDYCLRNRIDLRLCKIVDEIPEGASRENHWREQRFRHFFQESAINGNLPIILAHNLDDCLEELVMNSMVRGFYATIPYQHGPCIRPFRLWRRQDIEGYARKNEIPWIEDPSNDDYTKFTRAKIRSHVVPRIRWLNPGIYRIVEKLVREQDKTDTTGP